MLFDPHSQIEEETNTYSGQPYLPPHNQFNISAFTRQSEQHLASSFSNNCRLEEWMPTVTPLETFQSGFNSHNAIPNVRVSFDIYGNELPVEADSPLLPMTKHMELESIQEEELMSPDGVMTNQENSDPVLGVITPLKKKVQEPTRVMERRRSFALNRSPLLDITPAGRQRKCSYHVEPVMEVIRQRKCSYHVETTMERALLQNTTPLRENQSNLHEVPLTKKIR